MLASGFELRLLAWPTARTDAMRVRGPVFVDEQQVPADVEIDEWDAPSLHAVVYGATGEPLGTGRLTPIPTIGRMAVLTSHRRAGIGSLILRVLLDAAARRGDQQITIHAQVHAQTFYARHGFTLIGEPFEEVGIAHVTMIRHLPANIEPER